MASSTPASFKCAGDLTKIGVAPLDWRRDQRLGAFEWLLAPRLACPPLARLLNSDWITRTG